MQPYQKSVGSNGLQNVLFPLPILNITQGEFGGFSHQGSYAIDFVGSSARSPYYAPCDLICYFNDGGSGVFWQSINDVNLIDGTVGRFRILFYHDNDYASFRVGETRSQGDVIGHTGTAGMVTGDHVHIETGRGAYTGGYPMYQNAYGVWCLRDSNHMYDNVGVNDTSIINGYGYNWRTFATKPPNPVMYQPEMQKVRKNQYQFRGHATAQGNAIISSGHISIHFYGNSGSVTLLYNWSGGVNVVDWYTAWDIVAQIKESGFFRYSLTATDNYGSSTINSYDFSVEYEKTDDIIPLYFTNIITGYYV